MAGKKSKKDIQPKKHLSKKKVHSKKSESAEKKTGTKKRSRKKPFVLPDFSKYVGKKGSSPGSADKPIAHALHELKKTVLEVTFSICWLDCLIMFMLSLLVLKLVSVGWYWCFVPSFVYSVFHIRNRLKKASDFSYVEEKVPELKEKISTVADNLTRNNPVIEELNDDVLKGMHLIRTSYFFSFGRMTRELLTLAVLAFLVTGVSAYDVQFVDFSKVIDDVSGLGVFKGNYDINGELLEYDENMSDDIYGNKSVAVLGNEELKVQINPVLSDVDISKIEEPRERNFRSRAPDEISAETDSSYEDSIPKDYQTIVKNYFKEITKSK